MEKARRVFYCTSFLSQTRFPNGKSQPSRSWPAGEYQGDSPVTPAIPGSPTGLRPAFPFYEGKR